MGVVNAFSDEMFALDVDEEVSRLSSLQGEGVGIGG